MKKKLLCLAGFVLASMMVSFVQAAVEGVASVVMIEANTNVAIAEKRGGDEDHFGKLASTNVPAWKSASDSGPLKQVSLITASHTQYAAKKSLLVSSPLFASATALSPPSRDLIETSFTGSILAAGVYGEKTFNLLTIATGAGISIALEPNGTSWRKSVLST